MFLQTVVNVLESERIAYAMPANMSFIEAAEGAGYSIEAVPNTVESTIPMNGTVSAITLSVTHLVNAAYTIDPNLEKGAFVAPDIIITNNRLQRI